MKSNDSLPTKTVSDEEIAEKRTSVLGYVLLTLMVIFIITTGNTVFEDLSKIPEKPIPISNCIKKMASESNFIFVVQLCEEEPEFTFIDKQFGLDSAYSNRMYLAREINIVDRNRESTQYEIDKLERSRSVLFLKYGLALQEEVVNLLLSDELKKKGISEKNKKEIERIENQLQVENQTKKELNSRYELLDLKWREQEKSFKHQFEKAEDFVKKAEVWFRLKQFLLQVLFLLPLLALSITVYLKLKQKNSPYTIILTAVVSAFSILFLQVSLVLLYSVVPHKWLGQLFQWLSSIPFFSYVFYYFTVISIILFFGGLVFYIQKRVFNPTVVARRRLRENKCPNCSFPIQSYQVFCSDCGTQLKKPCPHCGKLKHPHLAFCGNCGKSESDMLKTNLD